MRFDKIKSRICDMIKDRFEFESNIEFENELLSLADENLKNKEILRIKRIGIKVNSWKTLILVEIEVDDVKDIKVELKKTISWLATVKESLIGIESTDLYLFLAFSGEVCIEECLRIESTEQFCRKYVLLPGEELSEFLNRTFLQEIINNKKTNKIEDPLERAFYETAAQYSWLTPEIQKIWKKAFSDLSGNELVDALLEEGELT